MSPHSSAEREPASNAGVDEAVRQELLSLVADDQATAAAVYEASQRTEGHQGRFVFDIPRSEWLAEYHDAERRTAEHSARLKALVARVGWPGNSLAGRDGARAAWIVAQHAGLADPAFQGQCVPLLATKVAEGDADPEHLAALVDRVELEGGRDQVYGTHLEPDGQGGWRAMRGVRHRNELDARRRQLGLKPWAEYLDDCLSGRFRP